MKHISKRNKFNKKNDELFITNITRFCNSLKNLHTATRFFHWKKVANCEKQTLFLLFQQPILRLKRIAWFVFMAYPIRCMGCNKNDPLMKALSHLQHYHLW